MLRKIQPPSRNTERQAKRMLLVRERLGREAFIALCDLRIHSQDAHIYFETIGELTDPSRGA